MERGKGDDFRLELPGGELQKRATAGREVVKQLAGEGRMFKAEYQGRRRYLRRPRSVE